MRADFYKLLPDGVGAMHVMDEAIQATTLERSLLELIKIRVSQINGCGFCLAMHGRDARAGGERQTRLDTVAAWRETPFFSDREKASLAWCEAVTLVSRRGVPEKLFRDLAAHFTPEEITALTFAVVSINGWNRLAIALSSDPAGLEGLDADRVAH